MVLWVVDGRVFLLTFDCLLKAPQPVTGLFLHSILCIWKFHNSDNINSFLCHSVILFVRFAYPNLYFDGSQIVHLEHLGL